MDFGTAIGKPFSNITNLVIGIVLMIIPIVNILTIPGYLLRVAKKTMDGDKKLPGFGNFGELVISSIKMIVVGIVYGIIGMIVAFILMLIPFVGAVLVIIWYIVLTFIIYAAMMTLAQTNDIGAALGIPTVTKKALKGSFIIAVIVAAIVTGIIASIVALVVILITGASLLPLLMSMSDPSLIMDPAMAMELFTGIMGMFMILMPIMIILSFILNVFFITIVAEAYKKTAA
ncbi:MAG: DUF4013 domain-containing protein [archaeon]